MATKDVKQDMPLEDVKTAVEAIVDTQASDMSPPVVNSLTEPLKYVEPEGYVTLCCDDPDVVVKPQLMPSELQSALLHHISSTYKGE